MAPIEKRLGLVARLLLRLEATVNAGLGVLSLLAIALVVSSEFVLPSWKVPYLEVSWPQVQILARTIIWLSFVLSFLTYAVISKRPFHYAREHFAELLICITWIPYYNQGALLFQGFDFGRVVPMDVLQLLGTLAHAWRLVRFTTQRFSEHPLIVVGSAALLLVGSCAALLNYFEPETFPTFWEGCWFTLTTIASVGYGDIVPKTAVGKIITSGTIILGLSLSAVFIGLMSAVMRSKIIKKTKNDVSPADLLNDLQETKRLIDQVLQQQSRICHVEQELAETKALLQRLVELIESGKEKQLPANSKPLDPPVDPADDPVVLIPTQRIESAETSQETATKTEPATGSGSGSEESIASEATQSPIQAAVKEEVTKSEPKEKTN